MIFLFTDQRKRKKRDASPVPDKTRTKRKERDASPVPDKTQRKRKKQGTSNEMSLQKQQHLQHSM